MSTFDHAVEQWSSHLTGFLHTATDDDWPLETFVFDLTCSVLFLTAGFFYLKSPSMDVKKVSWILSALTSMSCATLSLWHVNKLIESKWNLGAILYTDDRLARFTVTLFIAFLLLDLVLGCRYYRKQINLLSGWVHHAFYLWLCTWALRAHFTCGFCIFLTEELPTFILALGSIYPEYRSDLGFGVTFFITRLAYHALLFELMLEIKQPQITLWPATAIALLLHCYWFYAWARSYRRKILKQKHV